MQYETITMPDAGIGSFLTSNLDEIDDNVLMFGNAGGINSIKEVADRMAAMGNGRGATEPGGGTTVVLEVNERQLGKAVTKVLNDKNPLTLA